jgi:hypothetical protein
MARGLVLLLAKRGCLFFVVVMTLYRPALACRHSIVESFPSYQLTRIRKGAIDRTQTSTVKPDAKIPGENL